MQEQALKDRIWQELKRVRYPGYDQDIVSFGLVQRVAVCDGLATVSLDMGRIPSEAQQEVVAKVRDAITPRSGRMPMRPRALQGWGAYWRWVAEREVWANPR